MTPVSQTRPRESNSAASSDTKALEDLVAQAILDWRTASATSSGPSTREFLNHHPEVERHRSLLLDLAVEEYCLRRDRGETLDPTTFAAQFPTIGESLAGLLLFFKHNGQHIKKLLDIDGIKWPKVEDHVVGFLLLQELRRGHLSRVYLAAELSLGHRLVVLKITATPTQEAHVLGRLSHPHIVPILSVQFLSLPHETKSETTTCTVVAMPFLGCTTLDDVIRRLWSPGHRPTAAKDILQVAREGTLGQQVVETDVNDGPLSDVIPFDIAVVRILVKVSQALHFAYQNDVLHRDLKPSNILLSAGGHPLIMDFGASVNALDRAVSIAGTIPYMAPECLDVFVSQCNTPSAIPETSIGQQSHRTSSTAWPPHDQRSDVFSFGVILYEILTGRLPFGSASQHPTSFEKASVLLSRQHRNPLRRNDCNRHLSEELFQIVDDCLAPTVEQRPDNFACLTERLQKLIAQRGFDKPNLKTRRRDFLKSALSLVGVAALVTGGLVYNTPNADHWEAGVHAYERGDFGSAISCFSAGVAASMADVDEAGGKSTPVVNVKIASLRFGLGQSFRQTGNVSDAERQFEEAVKLCTHPKILACLACLRGQREASMQAMAINDLALQEWRKFMPDLDSSESSRMRGRVENNFGYHLLRGGQYFRGQSQLGKAESSFALSDSERRVVCCNQLDGLIRLNVIGEFSNEQLLVEARRMPSCSKGSRNAGLVYFMTARAIVQADPTGVNEGRGGEVIGLLLSAIAEGCPKEVLMDNDVFRGMLSTIKVPDALFDVGKSRVFSLSHLLLYPTESCRL